MKRRCTGGDSLRSLVTFAVTHDRTPGQLKKWRPTNRQWRNSNRCRRPSPLMTSMGGSERKGRTKARSDASVARHQISPRAAGTLTLSLSVLQIFARNARPSSHVSRLSLSAHPFLFTLSTGAPTASLRLSSPRTPGPTLYMQQRMVVFPPQRTRADLSHSR